MKNRLVLKTVMLMALCIIGNLAIGQRNKNKDKDITPAQPVAPISKYLGDKDYPDFIPVKPLEYNQHVEIYDYKLDTYGESINAGKKGYDTVRTKQMGAFKDAVLNYLSNEESSVTVTKIDSNGKKTYSMSGITDAPGTYVITYDYTKYMLQVIKTKSDDKDSCSSFGKIGVGLRVTVHVDTRVPNISLSSLYTLGEQAEKGNLAGAIHSEIMGIEGEQVTDLVILPTAINSVSVQMMMQAITGVKFKVYNSTVKLLPELLAVKRVKGPCSVDEVMLEIKPLRAHK